MTLNTHRQNDKSEYQEYTSKMDNTFKRGMYINLDSPEIWIQHRSDVDIGLLIGRNVPAAFQPINVIFGKDKEPWAEQYKFGWTIIGGDCKDKQQTQNSASVNRVTVERETFLDRSKETSRLPPLKKKTNTKGLTSPKQVCEMMELDYSEIHHSRKIRGTKQAESIEDKRFQDMLPMGLHKNRAQPHLIQLSTPLLYLRRVMWPLFSYTSSIMGSSITRVTAQLTTLSAKLDITSSTVIH